MTSVTGMWLGPGGKQAGTGDLTTLPGSHPCSIPFTSFSLSLIYYQHIVIFLTCFSYPPSPLHFHYVQVDFILSMDHDKSSNQQIFPIHVSPWGIHPKIAMLPYYSAAQTCSSCPLSSPEHFSMVFKAFSHWIPTFFSSFISYHFTIESLSLTEIIFWGTLHIL